ncbi:hypothetical protein CLV80_102240 [Yoonia maritima]|uniref:Uncharacterized protein n=1 Tax=Yoonia maritima TaxID=1435347 RepID=A0A2T0W302_9RHOB|nr:hypothetical protein [Yoonia maritima]PRY79595.1 hypothetical protein CLV80_102240 [Yoonia maritima]
MAIQTQFPKGCDPVDYLSSFAPALIENGGMYESLLGMQDSLRQAKLIPLEPLGMLACLTAEEEAATFLYYALRHKGYEVSCFGKLRQHPDKIKFVVLADVISKYFFDPLEQMSGLIRVERSGENPQITVRIPHNNFEIVQDDPLETIVTFGNGEKGHDVAVERAIDMILDKVTPKGFTIKSHIKNNVANRRNFCLYGSPPKKFRLSSEEEVEHFIGNCVVMILFGFLVHTGRRTAPSLQKIIDTLFEKI